MTASKPELGHELDIMGTESECSYLPARKSLMHYRVALSLTPDRYESLLERGWRRFGRTMFRPVCRTCSECRSLRVDVANFQPTKSQRRAAKKNRDVELTIGKPAITDEHIDLYNLYHKDMHERKGWPYREIDVGQYHESFVDGQWSFSREFQYRHHGELIGLGLVDMTANAMSSIYFIHAPKYRDNALGTASVLREIETGRESGRQWLYMGYYIKDCGSMNYKNRFLPHEILRDYATDEEPAVWEPPGA